MEYEDIIDLSHHVSRNHSPMSMMARAAQFAPFSALTGLEIAIDAAEDEYRKACMETDSLND